MKDFNYLIAPILGWLVAQAIKFGLTLRKDGISWSDAVQSGGMPSSHSSFMVALTTLIGLEQGIKSVVFAISFSVTAIIVYDSFGVRRTVGEQCDAIDNLCDKNVTKPKIHISKGHTPAEVMFGCITGFTVGLLVYLLL
jgi:uncharacterized protein